METVQLFWTPCFVEEAVPDVQDAFPVGEGAGGSSPRVSLFFVSLGVPHFQGASPVASPARLALLGCYVALCWGCWLC